MFLRADKRGFTQPVWSWGVRRGERGSQQRDVETGGGATTCTMIRSGSNQSLMEPLALKRATDKTDAAKMMAYKPLKWQQRPEPLLCRRLSRTSMRRLVERGGLLPGSAASYCHQKCCSTFTRPVISSERTGKGTVRLSIFRSPLQGSWTSSAAHVERAAATLLHLRWTVFLYFRVVAARLRKDLYLQ